MLLLILLLIINKLIVKIHPHAITDTLAVPPFAQFHVQSAGQWHVNLVQRSEQV